MAFGFSGAALSSTISHYRIHFLSIAFLFLGIAFYYTYKPAGAKKGAEPGGSASTKKQTFSIKKLHRVMLWIVAVITLAIAFLPYYVHFFSLKKKEQISEEPCCPAAAKATCAPVKADENSDTSHD